jgi:signal transduction histidine kinase
MAIAKSRRRFDLVLPLSLLALLLVLAWLQYRWTGALSRAEAERLKSGVSSSLARFRGELDEEIARILRSFSMRSPSELPEALAEFRRQAHYPEIVSDLYRLGFEEGRFELAKLEEDGTFARTGPPPGLERLAVRAEALRHPHRRRTLGPPLALVSSDPISIVVPARWEPGDAREPAATMVVFSNDVIAERLLPDLAARVFGSEETLDFDVVVVDETDRVVFSSRENAAEVIRSADASSTLLSLRPTLGRPRPRRDRGPGPEAPPLPPPDLRREEGPWRAFVRHRAGSLDTVVRRARARNLALGSGVLFLLGTSIVLLTVSARRATELSERKMEFVAGVSHELRTPLAVIRSAAQNLADGSVSGGPQVRRYGGLIEAEGRRLEDLVEKVLELAGVQSRNQHSPRERVSITGIARSAIADSAAEARDRGIEVEADLPAADLFVLGDEDGLRRGVANLVENAIKHGGDKNSVRVSVEGLSGEVSISVSDRGPGIPPSEVPHLFEAFYRGRRARERQVRGSGLGLSLVQQIAREHGGRVEVKTNPGKGSRFSLILPMARSPEGSVE